MYGLVKQANVLTDRRTTSEDGIPFWPPVNAANTDFFYHSKSRFFLPIVVKCAIRRGMFENLSKINTRVKDRTFMVLLIQPAFKSER